MSGFDIVAAPPAAARNCHARINEKLKQLNYNLQLDDKAAEGRQRHAGNPQENYEERLKLGNPDHPTTVGYQALVPLEGYEWGTKEPPSDKKFRVRCFVDDMNNTRTNVMEVDEIPKDLRPVPKMAEVRMKRWDLSCIYDILVRRLDSTESTCTAEIPSPDAFFLTVTGSHTPMFPAKILSSWNRKSSANLDLWFVDINAKLETMNTISSGSQSDLQRWKFHHQCFQRW